MINVHSAGDGIIVLTTGGRLEQAELEQIATTVEHSLAANDQTHIYVEVKDLGGLELAALPTYLPRAAAMLKQLHKFGRIAVVTDEAWVRFLTKVESALLPGIRYETFLPHESAEALDWVEGRRGLPHATAFKIIETDRPNVLGFEIDGKITRAEMGWIAELIIDSLERNGPMRLLGRIGELRGFEPEAFLNNDYVRLKLKAFHGVERYALVGGPGWLRGWINFAAPLVKVEVRHFQPDEEELAWAWLGAHPTAERTLDH